MTSNSKQRYTDFGATVSQSMTVANLSRDDMAKALNTVPSQVSHLMTGGRKPAPKWVDLMATALNLTDEQRRELHLKAARQYGFKL